METFNLALKAGFQTNRYILQVQAAWQQHRFRVTGKMSSLNVATLLRVQSLVVAITGGGNSIIKRAYNLKGTVVTIITGSVLC
jgi:hypothetical protein